MKNKQDFSEIYETYYDRIYKYAYTLLLNREEAEDVTSETFLAAYTYYESFDPARASVTTWLTRIAHNKTVNLMRSAAYSKRTELPEGVELTDGADGFSVSVEASETVLRLYSHLTPEERDFLNLRYVMELRDREISSLLGLEEKTVNKRYQRLLAKCRTLLGD